MTNLRMDGQMISLILEEPRKAHELMGNPDEEYEKMIRKVYKIMSQEKVIEVDPRLEQDSANEEPSVASSSSSKSVSSGSKINKFSSSKKAYNPSPGALKTPILQAKMLQQNSSIASSVIPQARLALTGIIEEEEEQPYQQPINQSISGMPMSEVEMT